MGKVDVTSVCYKCDLCRHRKNASFGIIVFLTGAPLAFVPDVDRLVLTKEERMFVSFMYTKYI